MSDPFGRSLKWGKNVGNHIQYPSGYSYIFCNPWHGPRIYFNFCSKICENDARVKTCICDKTSFTYFCYGWGIVITYFGVINGSNQPKSIFNGVVCDKSHTLSNCFSIWSLPVKTNIYTYKRITRNI